MAVGVGVGLDGAFCLDDAETDDAAVLELRRFCCDVGSDVDTGAGRFRDISDEVLVFPELCNRTIESCNGAELLP
jgi:hypothetical protein